MRVGVLGCGNVGAPLVDLIAAQRPTTIAARTGLRLEVARVAVRDLAQAARDRPADRACSPTDAAAVVDDPDVDVVVELIGGIEPARELILAALKAGKPVVTANKELLANVGAELFAAAESAGVDLLFEAAVAGGIPLIRPLRESLVGEHIHRVMGIVNGTTNYILTRMTEAGATYADALAEAQSLGLRRARPDGRRRGLRRRRQGGDHRHASPSASGSSAGDVYHEGITGITADRHRVRRSASATSIKLLAIAEQVRRRRRSACGCTRRWCRSSHPLAVGARQLQRRVRRGRRGRRPDVLRARRRRRPRPPAPCWATSSTPPPTCRQGTHASIGALGTARDPPDRRRRARAYYLNLEVRRPARRARPGRRGVRRPRGVDPLDGAGGPRRRGPADLHHPRRPRGRRAGHAPRRSASSTPCDRDRLGAARHRRAERLMKYVSTRGAAPVLGLRRRAADRPGRRRRALRARVVAAPRPDGVARGRRYADVAVEVMWPYVEGSLERDDFAAMVADAYATFDHPDVVPGRAPSATCYLLELFWGPTLAFKDVALQLVGRLFDHELTRSRRAGHDRRSPPRATPARRPSRRASGATPSTSSSSTRPAASARCSAAR